MVLTGVIPRASVPTHEIIPSIPGASGFGSEHDRTGRTLGAQTHRGCRTTTGSATDDGNRRRRHRVPVVSHPPKGLSVVGDEVSPSRMSPRRRKKP